QEITHVADHVTRLSADNDGIATATGQCFRNARDWIELFTTLVEARNRNVLAKPHLTCIRRKRADEQIDQRRLTRAVRTDDADPIAALNSARECVDDRLSVESLADGPRLDDERTGLLRLARSQGRISGCGTIITTRLAHRLQCREASHVALASRRDPIAKPVLFLDDLAIELVLLPLFLGQNLVTPSL